MADPEVADMFAGLKKKKKKVQILDEPATSTSTAHAAAKEDGIVDPVRPMEDNADLTLKEDITDFSDLKKKKKKKAVALDLEEVITPTDETVVDRLGNTKEAAPAEANEANGSAEVAGSAGASGDVLEEFSGLKKKKKSKKSAFDLEAFEKELAAVEGGGAPASGDGTPAAGSDDEGAAGEGVDAPAPEGDDPFADDGAEAEGGSSKAELVASKKGWLNDGGRDYTYQELLGRFYSLLFASHPSLSREGATKRYTIMPPNMQREGTKKSAFVNIVDICNKLRREPEHVIQFLYTELGTEGSVDGSKRLILKGRYQQKQIETVLRRYINEYVTCKTCKLNDTILSKENRLYFITCETCGSRRSVSSIKVGYKAQTKRRPKAG